MTNTAVAHTDENQRQEFQKPWLTTDVQTRRLGYVVVGFLVFVVGGWSACAPIDSAALAPGTVQVEGKRQAIQHLEGGIVSEILVATGDIVESGQPLLQLDATRDKAELQIAQGRIFNTRAAVDRLSAERDARSEVQFSAILVEAAAADDRAAAAISREQSLVDVRTADRVGERSVLEAKKTGMRAVRQAKKQVADSLDSEIDDLADLLAEGFVDKQRLRQLERDRAELLGQIADLDVTLEEVDLQILQLEKRFKTEVVNELTSALEELYDLERTFETVSDRVIRSTIRAPVDGELLGLQINAVGAVIGSGDTLMEIVPDADGLFVETRVSPMDIDRVHVGQPAEVRFSVFKDAYLVSGTLTKLSADRLIDPSSDVAYYEGEVELVSADLVLLGDVELIPGMPAEVVIKTGQRTMLGYLTSPMRRIFSKSLTED
jgi:epimerase transport system membrane fusion protein